MKIEKVLCGGSRTSVIFSTDIGDFHANGELTSIGFTLYSDVGIFLDAKKIEDKLKQELFKAIKERNKTHDNFVIEII